ncbi:ABC transporter substrate-binding protein [Paenibacillus terreus]
MLAAILMIIFVLAGCGGNEATGTTSETGQTAAAGQPADQGDVRVIEHAMGKTEIKGTPQRIVTLYQGATDAAIALGVKPVGAVESWLEQPFYTYIRDDLDGVAVVGEETQPNLEEIAKLKPDLIIASKTRHEEIYEQLSQIAPTVTLETLYQFKETVDIMGQALNKEEEAKNILAQWDARVSDFKGKISAKLGDKWPIEASVLNFRADHARIYVTGFAGDILNELGFVRSEYLQQEADKGTVVIRLTDKESIPSMNADVNFVFLSDPGNEGAVQKNYEEWTKHPLWKNLDSVKAGQVFQIDEVAWNMGGGPLAANLMLDQLYAHFGLDK